MSLLDLDLHDRPVLVVGGGPDAARAAQRMCEGGAQVQVVAEAVCEDLADMVEAGLLTHVPRPATVTDVNGHWLVVAASDDSGINGLVHAMCEVARIWCLDPRGVPASLTALGTSVAVVAQDIDRERQVAQVVEVALAASDMDLRRAGSGPGTVTLVGGGPGDPGLITVSGRQALAAADVVVVDRLGPRQLLARLPHDVEIIDVGKTPGHHPVPQHEINALLVEHAQLGRNVVRLKGGDPFVFGRGGEEYLACKRAGVPVSVIPGVTSSIAGPGAAGIPVTHRGASDSFLVVTGHDGFTDVALRAVCDGRTSVVVLMGVSHLPEMVAQALAAGAAPDSPVAAVEQATTAEQKVTRSTLRDAATDMSDVSAPAVLVFGVVAGLGLDGGQQ